MRVRDEGLVVGEGHGDGHEHLVDGRLRIVAGEEEEGHAVDDDVRPREGVVLLAGLGQLVAVVDVEGVVEEDDGVARRAADGTEAVEELLGIVAAVEAEHAEGLGLGVRPEGGDGIGIADVAAAFLAQDEIAVGVRLAGLARHSDLAKAEQTEELGDGLLPGRGVLDPVHQQLDAAAHLLAAIVRLAQEGELELVGTAGIAAAHLIGQTMLMLEDGVDDRMAAGGDEGIVLAVLLHEAAQIAQRLLGLVLDIVDVLDAHAVHHVLCDGVLTVADGGLDALARVDAEVDVRLGAQLLELTGQVTAAGLVLTRHGGVQGVQQAHEGAEVLRAVGDGRPGVGSVAQRGLASHDIGDAAIALGELQVLLEVAVALEDAAAALADVALHVLEERVVRERLVPGLAGIVADETGSAVVVLGHVVAEDGVQALGEGRERCLGMALDPSEDAQLRQSAERGLELRQEVLIEQDLLAAQEAGEQEAARLHVPGAVELGVELLGGGAQCLDSAVGGRVPAGIGDLTQAGHELGTGEAVACEDGLAVRAAGLLGHADPSAQTVEHRTDHIDDRAALGVVQALVRTVDIEPLGAHPVGGQVPIAVDIGIEAREVDVLHVDLAAVTDEGRLQELAHLVDAAAVVGLHDVDGRAQLALLEEQQDARVADAAARLVAVRARLGLFDALLGLLGIVLRGHIAAAVVGEGVDAVAGGSMERDHEIGRLAEGRDLRRDVLLLETEHEVLEAVVMTAIVAEQCAQDGRAEQERIRILEVLLAGVEHLRDRLGGIGTALDRIVEGKAVGLRTRAQVAVRCVAACLGQQGGRIQIGQHEIALRHPQRTAEQLRIGETDRIQTVLVLVGSEERGQVGDLLLLLCGLGRGRFLGGSCLLGRGRDQRFDIISGVRQTLEERGTVLLVRLHGQHGGTVDIALIEIERGQGRDHIAAAGVRVRPALIAETEPLLELRDRGRGLPLLEQERGLLAAAAHDLLGRLFRKERQQLIEEGQERVLPAEPLAQRQHRGDVLDIAGDGVAIVIEELGHRGRIAQVAIATPHDVVAAELSGRGGRRLLVHQQLEGLERLLRHSFLEEFRGIGKALGARGTGGLLLLLLLLLAQTGVDRARHRGAHLHGHILPIGTAAVLEDDADVEVARLLALHRVQAVTQGGVRHGGDAETEAALAVLRHDLAGLLVDIELHDDARARTVGVDRGDDRRLRLGLGDRLRRLGLRRGSLDQRPHLGRRAVGRERLEAGGQAQEIGQTGLAVGIDTADDRLDPEELLRRALARKEPRQTAEVLQMQRTVGLDGGRIRQIVRSGVTDGDGRIDRGRAVGLVRLGGLGIAVSKTAGRGDISAAEEVPDGLVGLPLETLGRREERPGSAVIGVAQLPLDGRHGALELLLILGGQGTVDGAVGRIEALAKVGRHRAERCFQDIRIEAERTDLVLCRQDGLTEGRRRGSRCLRYRRDGRCRDGGRS